MSIAGIAGLWIFGVVLGERLSPFARLGYVTLSSLFTIAGREIEQYRTIRSLREERDEQKALAGALDKLLADTVAENEALRDKLDHERDTRS
jgi:hypothetical protein